jgi:hypothetical protein
MRTDELQISRETIDHVAGVLAGFSAKVLSLKKIRRIGMETLGPFLDVLGLKLVAIPNGAALERNKSRLVKRCDAHARSAKARWQHPVA